MRSDKVELTVITTRWVTLLIYIPWYLFFIF